MADYVIRGGRPGYERLLLLARSRWPDTEALLRRGGIRQGLRCVDLGCGGGEVTLAMAGLVAPGGTVVGVDMDEVKLELASKAAAERGVANVKFQAGNVDSWDEPDAYDLVYCRFLLQHLREPVSLLRRMWAGVRSGGVLAVEDADFDGWVAYPPNAGFDFFVRSYATTLGRRGGDHTMGRQLYRHLLDLGVVDLAVSVVQPVISGEFKTLPLTTLEFTAPAIIAEGVASEFEVEAAVASLREFTDDPSTLISGPRVFQVLARRPGAPNNSA